MKKLMMLATAISMAVSAPAMAQVSPLMGRWTGETFVNGAHVDLTYIFTGGNAVTRRAFFSTTGLLIFIGHYEILGSQLHIIWTRWQPRSDAPPDGSATIV